MEYENNSGKIFLGLGLFTLIIICLAIHISARTPDPAVYVVINGVKQPDKYYSCSITGRGTGYSCYRAPYYKGGSVLFNGNTLYLEWAE